MNNHIFDQMKARNFIVIVFLALIGLVFASGQVGFLTHFYLTCALLVVLTTGIMFFVLEVENPRRVSTPLLIILIAFGLLCGFLSSWIVGSQTHDQYDGGPSLGIEQWPFLLGVVYPVCFFLFVFSLRFLPSVIQICMLFIWALATGVIGYFSSYRESFYKDIGNKDMYYDSIYFPSATKFATPIIVCTVLLYTVWLFFAKRKKRKSDNPIHDLNSL